MGGLNHSRTRASVHAVLSSAQRQERPFRLRPVNDAKRPIADLTFVARW
jgi:hypothetical protein